MVSRAKLRSVLAKIKINPTVRNPGESLDENKEQDPTEDTKRFQVRKIFREIEDRLPRNPIDEFIDILGGHKAVAEVRGGCKIFLCSI